MIDDDYLRASQIKNLMILSQSSDIIFQIKHILLIKQKVWLTYRQTPFRLGTAKNMTHKILDTSIFLSKKNCLTPQN